MELSSEKILVLADMAIDAAEMNRAALAQDFDEARFRAHIISAKAYKAGYLDLAAMAARTHRGLGPAATRPLPGFAHGMLCTTEMIGVLFGSTAPHS